MAVREVLTPFGKQKVQKMIDEVQARIAVLEKDKEMLLHHLETLRIVSAYQLKFGRISQSEVDRLTDMEGGD